MYGPSYFTGRLIARFGAPRVVTTGLLLIAASAGAGLAGTEIAHFWLSMTLLGIGWNFGFLGARSGVPSARGTDPGADPGPGVQRLSRMRNYGCRYVRIRRAADEVRLGDGLLDRVSAVAHRLVGSARAHLSPNCDGVLNLRSRRCTYRC